MAFRPLDLEKDEAAVQRIFHEIGWGPGTDNYKECVRRSLGVGRALVAEVRGEAEAVASNHQGRLTYLGEDLPLCIVSAVAASRVGRKQGFASRLTAEAFYDRLGFGTGCRAHWVRFDPAHLTTKVETPPPVRLSIDDWERVHANRAARPKTHGAFTVDHPESTHADMLAAQNGFGLGFTDPQTGELTHHLWCSAKDRNSGPYGVHWLGWRTPRQFLELMSLIRSLGDQVQIFQMKEPSAIQLQDLLRTPLRRWFSSLGSKFEAHTTAMAYWQVRILDLPGCLAKTRLDGRESVEFNLSLTDPIGEHLTEETRERWRGVAGDYVVTLGPESGAESGAYRDGLPTMRTSVNTFSRLWLGVRPATGLAVTSPDLDASEELLARLDRVLRLPVPTPDWDV
ncbi:MAG: GNAT family N-acetyltransferase [Planctomycetota bacterium]|jgi:hypothetical protein